MNSVTQSYKNPSVDSESRQSENSIVALTHTIFELKLVNESNFDQLINCFQKVAHASNADGAVNITILVPDANLHAFFANAFFSPGNQRELIGNLAIELSYIFVSKYGSFQCISPNELGYVWKYFSKSVAA